MEHVGIDIKFDNLDTFNKQIDVKFIDVDSELVDLNYKVASSIFCHVWRSISFTVAHCGSDIVSFFPFHEEGNLVE